MVEDTRIYRVMPNYPPPKFRDFQAYQASKDETPSSAIRLWLEEAGKRASG